MAQNGVPAATAVDKLPEGVVLPPKEIRAIIEKTADYISRNGEVFEKRLKDTNGSKAQFSFLTDGDAYQPFYRWRISEHKAGRGSQQNAKSAAPSAPAKPKGPEPPPDFKFSAKMPNINAQDLEVLRLTALHAARKGKSWVNTLSQREARNYQFDFLRPQHSLYNFFQRMVEQYEILLQTGPEGQKAEQARIRDLQDNITDQFRVLNLAKKRAEFIKHQESQKQKKEEAEEAERISYAQVDWHDFVVVHTIEFTEADEQNTDVPPPQTLHDLQTRSLEDKAHAGMVHSDHRIEEAMPDDNMNSYTGYQDQFGDAQPYPTHQPQMPYMPQQMPYQTPTPQPQYPAVPTPPPASSTPPSGAYQQPSSQSAPMRIRNDYIPRAQQRTQASTLSSICPNCKQSIPNSELEQHLRIELLDPSWKIQQAKANDRYSAASVGNVDVAANLKRLRDQGGALAQASKAVLDEEEERRKRQRVDGETTYPGANVPREQGKGLSVEEQVRNLHSRYGQ